MDGGCRLEPIVLARIRGCPYYSRTEHIGETVSAFVGTMGDEQHGICRPESNFGIRTVADMMHVLSELRCFAKQ
jgi:hypothetical protein